MNGSRTSQASHSELYFLPWIGTGAINTAGNALDNMLEGNAENNVFTAGHSADTLDGGTGNDTYVFSRGSGADLVTENDASAGNTDVASLGTGISSEQLWFAKSGHDLKVSIIGKTDTLTVSNWYLGSQYHIEQFKTADGKLLVDSLVQNLANAMAAFASSAAGQSNLGGSTASALAPVLAASWH